MLPTRVSLLKLSLAIFVIYSLLQGRRSFGQLGLRAHSRCGVPGHHPSWLFAMPRGVLKENLPEKVCVSCGRPFTWRKKWERCWDEVTTCSKSCNAKRREVGRPPRPARSATSGSPPPSAPLQAGDDNQDVEDDDNDDDDFDDDDAREQVASAPLPRKIKAKGALSVPSGAVSAGGAEAGAVTEEASTEEDRAALAAFAVTGPSPRLTGAHRSFPALGGGGSDDSETIFMGAEEADELPPGLGEWSSKKDRKKATKAQQRARREGTAGEDIGRKSCDLCARKVDLLVRCTVDASQKWRMTCGQCWRDVSGGVPDGDAAHPHYRYGGLWKNRSRTV